jgi:hypothetical protein
MLPESIREVYDDVAIASQKSIYLQLVREVSPHSAQQLDVVLLEEWQHPIVE